MTHSRIHNRTARFATLAAFATALVLLLGLAGPAAADTWIHMKVDSNDETVRVNLPIELVRAAASMITVETTSDIQVEFDDLDLTWDEMRDFWNQVKDAPEATFVTVQTADETVAVRKEGRFVTVRTTESREHGTNVDMQIPVEVVDALLSGAEGTYDFAAALDALVAYGPGNLLTVRDGSDRVEIWIDDLPQAD